MDVVTWHQLNAQITDESRRKYLISVPAFNKWSAETMRIPSELIPKSTEVEKAIQRDEQIAQLAQLGQVQNEGLQPQVEQLVGGMNVGQ